MVHVVRGACRAFCVVSICVSTLACGDDEASVPDAVADTANDSADSTPDTADSAADTAEEVGGDRFEAALSAGARALCEKAATCLPFLIGSRFGGDIEVCAAREYETVKPVLTAPGVSMTETQLEAAAAFFETADCEAIRRFVLGGELIDALAVKGTLADEAPCLHPYQCASGLCRRTFNELCGTCGPALAEGESCPGGLECGSAATCLGGKCARFRERDQDCGATAPCFPHDACIAGKCAPALPKDSPCTQLVGECDLQGASLVCDLALKTCQPAEWVESAADCGVREGHALICDDSACLPSPLFGTCQAYAADGAACNATSGPVCDFHASCIDGTCQTYYGTACP